MIHARGIQLRGQPQQLRGGAKKPRNRSWVVSSNACENLSGGNRPRRGGHVGSPRLRPPDPSLSRTNQARTGPLRSDRERQVVIRPRPYWHPARLAAASASEFVRIAVTLTVACGQRLPFLQHPAVPVRTACDSQATAACLLLSPERVQPGRKTLEIPDMVLSNRDLPPPALRDRNDGDESEPLTGGIYRPSWIERASAHRVGAFDGLDGLPGETFPAERHTVLVHHQHRPAKERHPDIPPNQRYQGRRCHQAEQWPPTPVLATEGGRHDRPDLVRQQDPIEQRLHGSDPSPRRDVNLACPRQLSRPAGHFGFTHHARFAPRCRAGPDLPACCADPRGATSVERPVAPRP